MSKFKIGDRVRDISPYGLGMGHSAGTIVGREHETWVIDWDATAFGKINWSDNQIEHLTAPTGPVVTETVKRIVPGVYGILEVGEIGTTGVRIPVTFEKDGHRFYDASELRAAAAVLTQLADALEDAK